MKKLLSYIEGNQQLKDICRLRGKHDLYLVGGTIRDILMDIEPRDYDFSVSGSGVEFARHVARKIGGAFVLMDESADEARVVKETLVYDFIGLDKQGVAADLERRDFTINAMAVNLTNLEFLDPHQGIRDVKKRIIRPIKPHITTHLVANPNPKNTRLRKRYFPLPSGCSQ